MSDIVKARTIAHMERLKHTKNGRAILAMLTQAPEVLPPLPKTLPPWEEHADITNRKPLATGNQLGNADKKSRIARAHEKMVSHWTNPEEIVAAYTDAATGEAGTPNGTPKSAVARIPLLDITHKAMLPDSTSVKGCELEAIRLALEAV